MRSLLGYIVGGFAIVFAMDYAAPPGGTGLNSWHPAVALKAPAMNVVNRAGKGDRAPIARSNAGADAAIATVEVIYRDRDGRVLFQTDPVANATLVVKGVSLPAVTVREPRRSAAEKPAAAETPSSPTDGGTRAQKIPEGCDPAFSPLAASARANNFTARCLS